MSAQPSWSASEPAWYDEATGPGLGREDDNELGDGLDDGFEYDDEDDDDPLD